MKLALSINSGSSSVKISLFSIDALHAKPRAIAEAQVSGLTSPPARLTYTRGGKTVHKDQELEKGAAAKNQADAFAVLLSTLTGDADLTEISKKDDIALAAHRIVHGGSNSKPLIITPDSLHQLESLNDLAPLHNAPALSLIETCLRELPSATNIAQFDTAFHASIPPHIYTYPIDRAVAEKNSLRKYGFHGLSYAFITRSAAAFLGGKEQDQDPADVNLICLHLGSGASACAVRAGQSLDTSMGLTPLAGLPGATRSGSVDPSLVFHYASDVGRLSPASTSDLHISRAEEILNKEAGWKALTGTTDFGAIAAAAGSADDDNDYSDDNNNNNNNKALAFDLFVDRVCGFVGSYYVTLQGHVDALVFAGGIGEKSARLRAAVVERCACLGFQLDAERNNDGLGGRDEDNVVVDVGAKNARHRVLICATDEQFEMARGCAQHEELWR